MKIPCHKLTMEWSGEYGQESSSTGLCSCGWQESASNQVEVRHEYRCHLKDVQRRENIVLNDHVNYWHGYMEMAARRMMSEDQCKNVLRKAIRNSKLPAWHIHLPENFKSEVEKMRDMVHTNWYNP